MNDHYGWKTIITIIFIILLLPLTIWGGPSGLICGGLAIAFIYASHLGDKREHEQAKKEQEEREEEWKKQDEEVQRLVKMTEESNRKTAELYAKHAEILKEAYELLYGKGFADKYLNAGKEDDNEQAEQDP